MNIFTKHYIWKKAKREHIKLPNNYEEKLQKYYDVVRKQGCKLVFLPGFNMKSSSLNAYAGFTKIEPIIATPEWAYQLIINDDEELENKFLITLGHELTHKDGKDIFPLKYGFRSGKFIAWTNEVHADFEAVEKIGNCNREMLVNNFLIKIKYKKDDIEDYSHPSNKRRLEYAQKYDFNDKLIEKIAKDAECENQKVIDIVRKRFEYIILK